MQIPSKTRALAPLTVAEAETRDRLRRHVEVLARDIGGRSAGRYFQLREAAEYIHGQLQSFGYAPERQTYEVDGLAFENISATLNGKAESDKVFVFGAHYDTAGGLPGANDNASGVAATLELAHNFAHEAQTDSIRWAFFANEEPPYFRTPAMGSYVYAKRCRAQRENIAGMLSLETIGYYSEVPGSQTYPLKFHPRLPDQGDFLGFVADIRSALLWRRVVRTFRKNTSLPAEGTIAPAGIPGIGWSDHWAFWQFGYRAVMVTDTAPYRYPYYHTSEDTPEKLDYDRMARAVTGLDAVVRGLAGSG
jgi:Zn-dependent M28 family amino/carboxypeptidase